MLKHGRKGENGNGQNQAGPEALFEIRHHLAVVVSGVSMSGVTGSGNRDHVVVRPTLMVGIMIMAVRRRGLVCPVFVVGLMIGNSAHRIGT